MNVKKIIGIGLFASCAIVALYFACFGKHGLVALYKLRKACKKQEQRIALMQKEIALLQHETKAWQEDPLKKESFLRYELAMGYTNELVYLIKK